jgi:nucleotide-binding universal stress UspA family protein
MTMNSRKRPLYERALVPLDGSAVAEAVIPFMLAIAGPLDMAVTLLSVVEPMRAVVADAGGPVIVDDIEARTAEAGEYLARVAIDLRSNGVKVSCEVRRGEAAATILAAARAVGADVIAMTTHGRTGFGRLLFGSVAEQVVRHADVPVLLMRQTEAQVTARRGVAQPEFDRPGRRN